MTPEESPSGAAPAQPEPEAERRDRAQEIRNLVESGEAVDEIDARDILNERDDIERIRGIDRNEAIARFEREFNDPGTESLDRWDLVFRRAAVEVGETPDELEFLWWNALADMPFGSPRDEAAERRQGSTRRRLGDRISESAARTGDPRAEELFARYRTRLQELHDAYTDLEVRRNVPPGS